MAVTKRTRFEVLRRDEHTCQYCGSKAPDVALQIDHVMPVALGGDDKPSNLVTACRDCNSGKSSIPPGSPLVSSLSDRAAAYALGMIDKMTRFRADIESLDDYVAEFHEYWDRWKLGDEKVPLPSDYRMSLFQWKQMGVPVDVFDLAIPTAQAKFNRDQYMGVDGIWKYMAGVVWNMVNAREIDHSVTDESAAVYTASEADQFASMEYDTGCKRGAKDQLVRLSLRGHLPAQDFVSLHVDHLTNDYADQYREGGTAPWQESMHKSDLTFGTTTTSGL